MDTLDWNTADDAEPRDTYYHTGCGGLVIAGYCTLCEMDEDEARAVLGGADPYEVALSVDALRELDNNRFDQEVPHA